MDRRDFIKLGSGAILSTTLVNISLLADADEVDFWQLVQDRIDSFEIKRTWRFREPEPLKDQFGLVRQYEGYLYSHDFFHMLVAKEWGITPTALSSLLLKDQIDIYACYIAMQQMQAVEGREADRKKRKKNA